MRPRRRPSSPDQAIRAEMALSPPPKPGDMQKVRRARAQGFALPLVNVHPFTGREEPMSEADLEEFRERFPDAKAACIHTVMSPEVRQELLEILREGHYPYVACAKVGISMQLFRHWLAMAEKMPGTVYETFGFDVAEATADPEIESLNAIRQAGKLPQFWTAAAWYLERTKPDQYAQKTIVKQQVEREVGELMRHLERNLPPDVFKMVVNAVLHGNTRLEAEESDFIDVEARAVPALPEATG